MVKNVSMSKTLTRIMAVVPFSVLSHGIKFRFHKHWWTKKRGSFNSAYRVDLESGEKYTMHLFQSTDLVAALKNDVPKRNHFEIKKEIKV